MAKEQDQLPDNQKENAISSADVSEFTVIGIDIHTSNAKESTAEGVIPKQWQKFFSEGIPAKIPNKSGANFYPIYTGYASDHHGEYS